MFWNYFGIEYVASTIRNRLHTFGQPFVSHPNPIERNSYSVRHVFYPPPFTCNKTRLECPKGVKDKVKQARRAKRVAEGHQLEIGAQRAPRFLVNDNILLSKSLLKMTLVMMAMVLLCLHSTASPKQSAPRPLSRRPQSSGKSLSTP